MLITADMTLHLTYTYLWVFLGLIWIVGVFIGNVMLAIGESVWWERLAVIFWPVVLPVVVVLKVLCAVFWPEY